MAPACCVPPDGMSSAFCGDMQAMLAVEAIDVHGHFGQLTAKPFASTPDSYIGYSAGPREEFVDEWLKLEQPHLDRAIGLQLDSAGGGRRATMMAKLAEHYELLVQQEMAYMVKFCPLVRIIGCLDSTGLMVRIKASKKYRMIQAFGLLDYLKWGGLPPPGCVRRKQNKIENRRGIIFVRHFLAPRIF